MKHALRKYISPCGSALFMVVSTMAALIVLVTAMYMSVLSSRQVQYATFDQEQAYVTSTSLADTIYAMFNNPSDVSGTSELVKKITNTDTFKEGDYVTATGSDLGVTSGGLIDSYNITITRISDEVINNVKWYVYDMAVTVDNNGIVETTHTFLRTKDQAPPKTPKLDKFFTATGYLPNDVVINSGDYTNPLYFDAEYVKIANMTFDNGQELERLSFQCPLTCAGTLTLDGIDKASPVSPKEPTDWVIGNDMTVYTRPYQFYLCGSDEKYKMNYGKSDKEEKETIVNAKNRGRLLVGGNFTYVKPQYAMNIGQSEKPTDLYVLGNCTIGESNGATGTIIHGNLYVNGDLIIASYTAENSPFTVEGNIYVNGNIICDDEVKHNAHIDGLNIIWNGDKWESESSGKLNKWSEETSVPGLSVSDARALIKERIGASVYPLWVVKKDELPTVDITFANDYVNSSTSANGYSEDIRTSLLNKGVDTSLFDPKFIATITEDCSIEHIYDYGKYQKMDWGLATNRQVSTYSIVIDTGKAGETRTINLKGNRDTDGDGVADTFKWLPVHRYPVIVDNTLEWHETDFGDNEAYINILTVGDGNLVINVDERPVMEKSNGEWVDTGKKTSVIYRSTSQEFFGHYGWFVYSKGQYNENTNGLGIPSLTKPNAISASKAQENIHYTTKCSGSSKCNYKSTNTKDEDGNELYKCTKHDTIVVGEPSKSDGENYDCHCDGRIEKEKFSGTEYYYPGELDGEYKYAATEQKPNVNIFIISCLESAQIIMADRTIMNSEFFGYIYAPYMTYMDNSNGGGLKSVGGLIVSDYIMSGYYTYVFALPDQDITEIAGENIKQDGNVTPSSNRDWRINGV